MTKTEELLFKKVDKNDCEKLHIELGQYLNEKFDSFKELVGEKLKLSTWIGLGQLFGLFSILIAMIVLILKK